MTYLLARLALQCNAMCRETCHWRPRKGQKRRPSDSSRCATERLLLSLQPYSIDVSLSLFLVLGRLGMEKEVVHSPCMEICAVRACITPRLGIHASASSASCDFLPGRDRMFWFSFAVRRLSRLEARKQASKQASKQPSSNHMLITCRVSRKTA